MIDAVRHAAFFVSYRVVEQGIAVLYQCEGLLMYSPSVACVVPKEDVALIQSTTYTQHRARTTRCVECWDGP